MQENIPEFQSIATREHGPPRAVSKAMGEEEAGKTARFFAVTPKKEEL
jgi:hypothetical protein